MYKNELIEAAQEHCDSSFTMVNVDKVHLHLITDLTR